MIPIKQIHRSGISEVIRIADKIVIAVVFAEQILIERWVLVRVRALDVAVARSVLVRNRVRAEVAHAKLPRIDLGLLLGLLIVRLLLVGTVVVVVHLLRRSEVWNSDDGDERHDESHAISP